MDGPRHEPRHGASLTGYALAQFLVINLLALAFLLSVRQALAWEPWLLVLAILWGCVSLGLLFDGQRLAPRLEGARQLGLAVLAMGWVLWAGGPAWVGWALAGFHLASLLWLGWLLRERPSVVPA